jgi:hypothetical protein
MAMTTIETGHPLWPTTEELESYLVARGWRRWEAHDEPGRLRCWYHPEYRELDPSGYGTVFLALPGTGYLRGLSDLLVDVGRFEERAPRAVLLDILNASAG